jgi:2,5-diamino-6-(ribosylamino)-4(3H)-pyrimidinone 5'-phosphate reductase
MHVRINAAISADGKLSSRKRTQIAISGEDDFDRVETLRAESDAVMVGVGTVLADDPSLTVADPAQYERDDGVATQPARVVADSRIRTPPDAAVLDDEAESFLLVSDDAPTDFVQQMKALGATVIEAGENRVALDTAFEELASHGIEDILVEGGGEIIYSLFDHDLVDEFSVFVGPLIIGGRDAPTLADGTGFVEDFPQLTLEGVERLDDGVVLTYDVP